MHSHVSCGEGELVNIEGIWARHFACGLLFNIQIEFTQLRKGLWVIVDNTILIKRQFDPKEFENLNFALQKLHRSTLLGLFTQFHISFPAASWAQDDWPLSTCQPRWSSWPQRYALPMMSGSLPEHPPWFESIPCLTSRFLLPLRPGLGQLISGKVICIWKSPNSSQGELTLMFLMLNKS